MATTTSADSTSVDSTRIDATGVDTTSPVAAPPDGGSSRLGGRWIDHWNPEDPAFWGATGQRVARRNLIWSIVAEHIGFSVWLLWSIVVVQMTANPTTGAPAASGWALTTSQALWLVAVPSGVGALLRLPYTFAVPHFGGRNWTVASALLLVIPCLGLAWAVSRPGLSFGVLLAVAAEARGRAWPTSRSSTRSAARAGRWA
jgi:NNP family nitrate/nitrite transporter-like MFS transporter